MKQLPTIRVASTEVPQQAQNRRDLETLLLCNVAKGNEVNMLNRYLCFQLFGSMRGKMENLSNPPVDEQTRKHGPIII